MHASIWSVRSIVGNFTYTHIAHHTPILSLNIFISFKNHFDFTKTLNIIYTIQMNACWLLIELFLWRKHNNNHYTLASQFFILDVFLMGSLKPWSTPTNNCVYAFLFLYFCLLNANWVRLTHLMFDIAWNHTNNDI